MKNTTVKLSHFRLCSLSRQIRVLMNSLNISYISKERDISVLHSIERISPTIVISDDNVLTGFWSIYQYLTDYYTHYLLPSKEEQLNFLSDLELINGKFYYEIIHAILIKTFTNHRVINYDSLRTVESRLRNYLVFFNNVLQRNDGFFHTTKSMLDIALACHISTLDYLNYINFKDYPFIYRWYMVMKSEPAFRELLHDLIAPITPPVRYSKIDFEA